MYSVGTAWEKALFDGGWKALLAKLEENLFRNDHVAFCPIPIVSAPMPPVPAAGPLPILPGLHNPDSE
ncbi:MAG: hypothetical protein RLZZ568_2108 [Cyanobacteriota bacterium]